MPGYVCFLASDMNTHETLDLLCQCPKKQTHCHTRNKQKTAVNAGRRRGKRPSSGLPCRASNLGFRV